MSAVIFFRRVKGLKKVIWISLSNLVTFTPRARLVGGIYERGSFALCTDMINIVPSEMIFTTVPAATTCISVSVTLSAYLGCLPYLGEKLCPCYDSLGLCKGVRRLPSICDYRPGQLSDSTAPPLYPTHAKDHTTQ